MKPNTILHCNRALLTFLSGLGFVSLIPLHAQTYTWDQQALGQVYLTCPNPSGPGYPDVPYYYPSNNFWSQAAHTNSNCDRTATVFDQPSNWSPWLPLGVYPGGPGAVGVDVIIGGLSNGVPTPLGNTYVDGGVRVTVNGLTLQTNGSLNIGYISSITANTIDIQGDTLIRAGSYAGALYVASGGTLTKSGGSGTLSFGKDGYGNAVAFQAVNANLVVKSGTFALPYNSAGGWFGGTFSISNDATVVLNVDSSGAPLLCDTITGMGGGTVAMTGRVNTYGHDFYGNLHQGLTLNFPGNMFQWSGGAFVAGGPVTNAGVLNLTNSPYLLASMFNNGILKLADNSTFDIQLLSGGFYNGTGSTFNIMGDSSVVGGDLNNYGLVVKSAGTGTSQISAGFRNYGGTVQADTGTLALNLGRAGYLTNTTFVVSNGAAVTLLTSNYSVQVEGMLTGSGGGTVVMNNGTLLSFYNGSLNFPGLLFHCAGGVFQGPLRNAGTINLVGPASIAGSFTNAGLMVQSGAGSLGAVNMVQSLNNDPSGVYRIRNDNGFSIGTFNNAGLLEKVAGTGTSVIDAPFNNSGTIQAASGSLLFTGGTFAQNAGTLQLTPAISFGPDRPFYLNGGTVTGVGTLGGATYYNSVYAYGGVLAPGNPFGVLSVPAGNGITLSSGATFSVVLGGSNQFSQLAVDHLAYINGTLNVTLANGYLPTIGTQFHIISSPTTSGPGFSTLNVPQGISVNYSNTSGVYLLVTNTVISPVQLLSPQVAGGNFKFSFATINGQTYTIQQNTNLVTNYWADYTNFTGNGSLLEFAVPAAGIPQRFFRVRQP